MIIVEECLEAGNLPEEIMNWKQDTLTLTWEERCKSHGRRTTDDGQDFAISLTSGYVLSSKDALSLTELELVVTVVEADEPVVLVKPNSTRDWAWLAYQIGNRHQTLMITDTELICASVPGVLKLLEQLGVPFLEQNRPFQPILKVAGHHH